MIVGLCSLPSSNSRNGRGSRAYHPRRTRMRCSSISSIYGSRKAACHANTWNSVRDICDIGEIRGVRKQSNSNGLRPYHEHLCRVSQQDKSKGENNLPSQEAANGIFVFLQLDGFFTSLLCGIMPSALPERDALKPHTAISFQYSQPRKRKREKRAKEKGELPRPGCFHNGIILIVNSW